MCQAPPPPPTPLPRPRRRVRRARVQVQEGKHHLRPPPVHVGPNDPLPPHLLLQRLQLYLHPHTPRPPGDGVPRELEDPRQGREPPVDSPRPAPPPRHVRRAPRRLRDRQV